MSINVPTSKELLKAFMDRYKTAEARYRRRGMEASRNLEAVRIKRASDYVSNKLREIATSMPFLKNLHPFYRELFLLHVDELQYKRSASKLFNSSRAIKSIRKEALIMIKGAASKRDLIRARRRFVARMTDLINDLEPELDLLSRTVPYIKSTSTINTNIPTIVVAGMPNTGKSSLVACVSTAKPEVADYPFTTKRILAGHIRLFGEAMIQILDTPGLLDRPLSERNSVELQTVLALRHLAHVIAVVIDPTLHSGNTLESQLNLLREIRNSFKVPIAIIINKIDIATAEEVNRAEAAVGSIAYKVAASKCLGTREAIDDIIDKFILPTLTQSAGQLWNQGNTV